MLCCVRCSKQGKIGNLITSQNLAGKESIIDIVVPCYNRGSIHKKIEKKHQLYPILFFKLM